MKRSIARRLRLFVYRLGAVVRDRVFPESQGPSDQNWQRIVLNREVSEYIAGLDIENLSAAEISGKNHAGRGWKEFTDLNYPGFDLCDELPDELRESFDVVICEQVLEHVVDPFAAVRNLSGLCRPGGHVIVSSPFLVKIHELPAWGMYDYWRFSPRGLKVMLERSGLEVETVSTWGNRECIVGNMDRWTAFRRWHPTHNEPDLPVQVWAFARRPPEGRDELLDSLTHADPSQLWFQLDEIVNQRTYLRHGVVVKPGYVVVDAGANVGVAAAFFLTECDGLEVHSFEPVTEIYEMLVENVEGRPGASTYNFGLSSQDETVDFVYYEGAAAMSSRYAEPERDHQTVKTVLKANGMSDEAAEERLEGDFEPATRTCRLKKLSTVIREESLPRIDLLKIDVERAELDVLQGIDDEDWPLIGQVVAEVHDEDGRLDAIRNLLEAKDMTVVVDQEENRRDSNSYVVYAVRS